jgi:serine O-acetyltransferase
MRTIDALRKDLANLAEESSWRRTLVLALTNRGFHALVLHRTSRVLWMRGIPILPHVLTRLMQHLFAVDIDCRANLGPGIVIFHCFGLVIGGEVIIEGDCRLYQGVALGRRDSHLTGSMTPDGHPHIERNVVVGTGAKVLGPVRIGTGSVIGANSVVLKDIPTGSIVAGVPGRVVRHRDIGL